MTPIPLVVPCDADRRLCDGDIVTIKGVRVLKNGHFTTRCRPGNETRFIVKRSGARCRKEDPEVNPAREGPG